MSELHRCGNQQFGISTIKINNIYENHWRCIHSKTSCWKSRWMDLTKNIESSTSSWRITCSSLRFDYLARMQNCNRNVWTGVIPAWLSMISHLTDTALLREWSIIHLISRMREQYPHSRYPCHTNSTRTLYSMKRFTSTFSGSATNLL